MHGFGGLLNGGDDAWVGSAAADISLQSLHNFQLSGIGMFLQERDAADNHSGCAIGALECALIEKGLLYGMKLAVLFETFDGEDGFSCHVANRKLAGTARRAIQQNGTGAALPFAATIFGSGETELFAQREQQCRVGFRFENATLSVYLYVDWNCYSSRAGQQQK